MTRYVNPYTNPAHGRWVADGHCDSISQGKVWCRGLAGHSGEHVAGNSYPDPPPYTIIRWTVEHPRDLGVPVTQQAGR